jgi:hypothetical protein
LDVDKRSMTFRVTSSKTDVSARGARMRWFCLCFESL